MQHRDPIRACTWKISKVTYVGVGLIPWIDHLLTMALNLNHYDNSLGRAHANYLAQMEYEISRASHQTNEVANRITVVAIAVVPLNIVTGMEYS